jgi:small-conductance mechanosensitive channel
MDFNPIFDFVIQHGLYLTILVLILVCLALGLTYLNDWFREIIKLVIKSKSKYLDKSIVEVIQLLVKIIFSIGILVILILVTSVAYPTFRKNFLEYFSIYFTPLFSIVITLIIITILTQVIHRFFKYLRIALKKREDTVVKSETTRFIELLLVYLVYIVGLTIVLVIALSTIGLSDPIWKALMNFFENNLAPIILIVIGLVIIYAISKFVSAFITDLKKQSTRYNPNTLDITQNIVNYILLIIAILLVVLPIFSLTGQSQLSETLLITIIIVVGLVLAMSASGSLGNFFAGLVLMFTSPFEDGDTVKIGNGTLGKVKSKALFSTNVVTENGEEIKFPNSKLIDSQLVNYSNSSLSPLIIDIKTNYRVESEKVHNLLKASAEKTEGINLENNPPKAYTLHFEPTSIKYRLRVYLKDMNDREEINSELLNNIQKTFKEAGVSFRG